MRVTLPRRSWRDEYVLLRSMGLALLVAVWLLGILAPRKGGVGGHFLYTYSALLVALALVDQTAPRGHASGWRRVLWLLAELVLSFYVVQTQGSLIRPALVYLLPAGQALLLFGERVGLAASLSVWVAYGLNIGQTAWPNRLGDFPNYFSFFLAPDIVAVVLTVATLRQVADRLRVQRLYDELRTLHDTVRQAAVAEERNRLAREIHDTLAHYLTVINVQLEAAEKLSAEQPASALQQLARARRLTLECLQEVRRSVSAMRAGSLDELSLPGALRRLTAEFGETTGIDTRLTLDAPGEVPSPPEVTLALFRAVQEGLTNVQRHARATLVVVRLMQNGSSAELTVEDNGIGPGEAASDGFGLLGLRERVELIGGHLSLDRSPSGGCRLRVEVPATIARAETR